MPKKKLTSEADRAVKSVESFVKDLTRACGKEWDDIRVSDSVWSQVEILMDSFIRAKIVKELGFNIVEIEDDDDDDDDE